MRETVNFNREIIPWAITRAGYALSDFATQFPKIKVQEWVENKKTPTINQLDEFAKKVHIPFGYLFLDNVPQEASEIIPFFRTGKNDNTKISLNLHEQIIIIQRRQEWLSEYLSDNGYEKLSFVGKYNENSDYKTVAADIREKLALSFNWAAAFSDYRLALNHLSDKIEDLGIIVVSSGVADEHNNRPIQVDECRGFVIVNEYAPFVFVNSKDVKPAQIFTLAHELAHIWLGYSAGFDFKTLLPNDSPIEILCDKIAAELLVPESIFNSLWAENKGLEYISRYFKVSRIVVARRALDLGKIVKSDFFEIYNSFISEYNNSLSKSGGGDFYDTHKKRVSLRFAAFVKQATENRQLLYTEAHRMTGMKGITYNKFMESHF